MTSERDAPNSHVAGSLDPDSESERDPRLKPGFDIENDQSRPDSAASTELTPDEAESREAMLTPIEARVLGCLMEKQRTTPDQYPLTLNALVTACNQKSAREPVMKLTPGEVGHCVGQLRDRGLLHASFTGRSERFDHKLTGHFMLDRQQQALLSVLMLRGPQTTGELRTNSARLAEFDSLAAVQSSLDQLAHHNPPLVRELPRQPGMREQRFVHLLCGEPSAESIAMVASARRPAPPAANAEQEALAHRVEQLETEVAALRAELDALKAELS
ncbi:MAG: YceH family protein [Lamprobacter sp.]|uniref:YceH family protein n=1 Tax=Lamprobacter sp. TaxID=3100796 RepID=UPI002B25E483|nr:YceH family protein [Lamprobacter sp.]MEA3640771.1 YceH family protein [Lamprobacter sp.]